MTRADKLTGGRIENYRARQVRTSLIERHEFVFGKTEKDAGIAVLISKKLVAADRKFSDSRHGDGWCALVDESLRQRPCCGSESSKKKRN